MAAPYFIGIDVGTQGARVVLIDATGNIIGSGEEIFPLDGQSREEQSPFLWWEVCLRLLKSLVCAAASDISLSDVKAISVTSTSGTVIPLDQERQPLHNAIMYSDRRSTAEGKICSALALQYEPGGYTGFNSSSGLSKMLWFVRNFTEKVPDISSWIHACDFLIGRLTDRWGISDYTNVLKSGYNVSAGYWPSYLHEKLSLKKEWFPQVVMPGTPIENISPQVAAAVGLPTSVIVVAGMTDGCASQIASGAVKLGDWNTTIGTTLVVKGVTGREIKDGEGRLYNHRHPEGYWMPGGASNIGADWITTEFGDDWTSLNEKVKDHIPTGHLAYPLQQQGERFPFIAPEARGFCPQGLSRAALFSANMEGVAYIERCCYELIENLSGEKVKAVYTAGGGSKSDAWLTIRTNVLKLPVYKMKNVSGAVGAAILAASKTHFSSVIEAVQSMTQIDKQMYPQEGLSSEYEKSYRKFLELLIGKGYIKNQAHA